MHVVLTGATGFLGRALVLRLLGDGHAITALVRDAGRARAALGAAPAIVPLADDAEVRRAVAGADAVVNLGGEGIMDRRWSAARKRALVASRVDLTRRLVDAIAARGRRLPVLVSASAVGWYGDRGDDVVDEAAPAGDDFAARLCRDWEAAAEAARPHVDRLVRARIGVVLGAGGGALASLAPPFRVGVGGPLGGGRQWVPWIHLDDAIEALRDAAVEPRLDGAVNLVAPTPVRNRDLAAALGRVLHRPAVMPAPAPLLRLVLGERAGLVLGGQHVVPAALTRAGFRFARPALDDALREALTGDAATCLAPVDPAVRDASPYLRARSPAYTLTARTVIARPLDEVFEFFADAENLAAITPAELGFQITSPTPIAMAPGATIDYRIQVSGVPLRWRTIIEAWEPARRFVDVQARGPYRCWWHEHRFRRDGDRTIMEDTVHYAPPLGPLGRIANRLFVADQLRAIFAQRDRAIRLRFAAPDAGDADRRAAAT